MNSAVFLRTSRDVPLLLHDRGPTQLLTWAARGLAGVMRQALLRAGMCRGWGQTGKMYVLSSNHYPVPVLLNMKNF